MVNIAHQLTDLSAGSGMHRSTAPDSPERTGLAESAGGRAVDGAVHEHSLPADRPHHTAPCLHWERGIKPAAERPSQFGTVTVLSGSSLSPGWLEDTDQNQGSEEQTDSMFLPCGECTGRPKHTSRGIVSK